MLNFSGAALDTYSITRLIDTRAGNNTTNHEDKQVDAMIDRIKQAATEEEYLREGQNLQRYIADQMLYPGVTTLPFIQAARAYVKGYENLHGHKVRFETTWLDKKP
jgi:ABC-type oligopeptide transport system substrate-binding subunit